MSNPIIKSVQGLVRLSSNKSDEMAKATKEVRQDQGDDNAEGASTHQFVSDFFRTDIMNHCEFLKQLNDFGGEDCYLIAEICNRLVDQTNGKEADAITPFYGVGGNDTVDAADVGKFYTHMHILSFSGTIPLLTKSITNCFLSTTTIGYYFIGHVARADFQKHKS